MDFAKHANRLALLARQLIASQYQASSIQDAGPKASGWLDTQGDYWAVPLMEHEKFALWYYQSKKEDPGPKPAAALEKRGWIHLSFGTVIITKEPTARQKDAIYDWLMSIGGQADFYGYHANTRMDVHKFLDHYASKR